MISFKSAQRQSGFTLVELLIVAIILAILAAIIVPQFASTTDDAKESALRANATAMRSAISLYRQQHGAYPGVAASSGGTCSVTAGAGLAGTDVALLDQLTRYSNALGQTCSAPETGFSFGPYVQDDTLPTNPITNIATVVMVSVGDLNMLADATPGGWKYDTLSGKFIPNDQTLDSGGVVAYSTY